MVSPFWKLFIYVEASCHDIDLSFSSCCAAETKLSSRVSSQFATNRAWNANLAPAIFFATTVTPHRIVNKRVSSFSESKVSRLLSYFEIYTRGLVESKQREQRETKSSNDKILRKKKFIDSQITAEDRTRFYAQISAFHPLQTSPRLIIDANILSAPKNSIVKPFAPFLCPFSKKNCILLPLFIRVIARNSHGKFAPSQERGEMTRSQPRIARVSLMNTAKLFRRGSQTELVLDYCFYPYLSLSPRAHREI